MTISRHPTLVQVAARAGVSLTTASKAINNQNRIAESTRARVVRAARELGYTPNTHARSLITGRSSTVGIVMFDSMTARFAVPILLGLEDALTAIDLALITADARGDRQRFNDLAEMLARRHVDGVVVVGDNNTVTPSISHLLDVPVVYVYGRSESPSDLVHTVDDALGGRLVSDHLVDSGRTRIAHLTGPRHSIAVMERLAGVREGLASGGLRIAGGVRHGPWSQLWARRATAALLDKHPGVDAVLCGSDQLATGVADAARFAGRRVPQDVAITGYDNWSIFALETEAPLTTVEVDLFGLGRAAAQDLFALVRNERRAPGVRMHPPSLVVRESSSSRTGSARP